MPKDPGAISEEPFILTQWIDLRSNLDFDQLVKCLENLSLAALADPGVPYGLGFMARDMFKHKAEKWYGLVDIEEYSGRAEPTPEQLTTIAQSLARLGVQPSEQFMSDFWHRCTMRVRDKFTPEQVQECRQALKALPSPDLG